ncbi:MAG: LysR family transcriptional regulator [Alphaproteobacteria bacterium]|nr:LysR family transcriptional regulator [Alphaproteobacteria bacterium]
MNKIERSLPKLESDVLRSFITVAAHGNITRAAEDLFRTQSAISVQIKRLEAEVGTPLFVRQARGMVLTPAGERLLVPARRIIAMLDEAAADMADDPITGHVTVGIPDDYGSELLATILADFANRHPAIDVTITCGFSVGFEDAVKRGKLDIAVYAGPQSEANGEVLRTEQTVWAGSPTLALPDSAPLPVALFDRSCWWRDAALGALEAANIAYRAAYSSESVAGVKAALKAGLAVGILARSTVEPGLRILGPADGLPPLPASNLMLISKKGAASPAMLAMADAIRRGFAAYVAPAGP